MLAMQQMGTRRESPALKQLVVEASQALARLDAVRLEELALSCQALNRELAQVGSGRADLARQAWEARRDMAVLARVLEVTRGNLQVMNRLRELRRGPLEYNEAQALGWTTAENRHGDN